MNTTKELVKEIVEARFNGVVTVHHFQNERLHLAVDGTECVLEHESGNLFGLYTRLNYPDKCFHAFNSGRLKEAWDEKFIEEDDW